MIIGLLRVYNIIGWLEELRDRARPCRKHTPRRRHEEAK